MDLNYKWNLKDANFTKDQGKVFSCFACGGGSTMGYKLAGFDVIGHNDIDPKMVEVYKKNHNPKFSFLESIQTFKDNKNLPPELFDLDILDGSPPCSSFSTSGNREADWGKNKKFREGQAEQILDRLFFDFIDLAKRLQPKIVIAENVKGLLLGEAINYVREIYQEFDLAGYYVQHFLLNASTMGVPQRRERVFFIALRKDLASPFLEQVDMFTQLPKISLQFNERPILFCEIYQPGVDDRPLNKTTKMFNYWQNRIKTDDSFSDTALRINNKEEFFNNKYIHQEKVCCTYPAGDVLYLFDEYRLLNKLESCNINTFPIDYDFCGLKYNYIMGMSVPPLMTAKIANQINLQWLKKIKNQNQ